MARKKRVYLNRVYIPQQRGLLGPRHRLKLAEIERPFDYHALPARWLHEHHAGVETVSQVMPRGGTRIMAHCPQCLALRRELYLTPLLRCRVCAGKSYLSRDGYRPRSRLTEAQRQAFQERYEFAESLVIIKRQIAVARGMFGLIKLFVKHAEQDVRRRREAEKQKPRRTSAEAKRLRHLRRSMKLWGSLHQACQGSLMAAQKLRHAA